MSACNASAFAIPGNLPTSFSRSGIVPLNPLRTARRSRVAMHVVLSGATGRTGRLVHAYLTASRTPVKALVRSESKGREVLGPDADLIIADITDRAAMKTALEGATSLIVLTSAIPQIISPGPPPEFGYPGGMPEMIDYQGAVNQIDAAKAAGVKQVVFVGSMGGTDPGNALNKMGNGNILVWKRKAEQYLIDAGVPYTVINPAGLLDIAPAEREVVFGKADDIFTKFERGECGISRGDVARIVVAALEDPNALNKAIDCASHAKDGFTPTVEFTKLFNASTAGL